MQDLKHDDIIRKKYLARGPGDEATKAYIAAKYLGGDDSKKKKKKKKSVKKVGGNIGIIDDEDHSWEVKQEQDDKEDDDEILVKDTGVEFRGSTHNWETIREGEDSEDEEERPVIVQEDNAPRMSNGQRAGILTKAEIKLEAQRAKDVEKRAMERLSQGQDAETVYRDTSGRKVDPKLKRAEELKKRQEQIEKEARKMEWGKGLVQREAEAKRKRDLEEEKFKPMSRYADDEDLNNELKERDRWNDPAAGFLTKKHKDKSKGTRLVKPTYKGAWKPNRFMIPPGYRWDGVDRSNGFEDAFLIQQNQAKSRAAEAHAWATEDM